jgi:hypothetical protein
MSVMIDWSILAVKLRVSVTSLPWKDMPLFDHFEPWSRSAVNIQHMRKPLTLYTIDDNHKPTQKKTHSPSRYHTHPPMTPILSNLPLCRAKTWAVSLGVDQKKCTSSYYETPRAHASPQKGQKRIELMICSQTGNRTPASCESYEWQAEILTTIRSENAVWKQDLIDLIKDR